MTTMTLALTDELHSIMNEHKEINWREIARQAMWNYAKKIDKMDRLLSKSEMSEEDAEIIGNKIKKEIARKHGLIK